MCLPLVARIVALEGEQAGAELLGGDGGQVRAGLALYPNVVVGDYVLLDRGLVIELIDQAQAEMMIAFYAELAEMGEAIEPSEVSERHAAELAWLREPVVSGDD